MDVLKNFYENIDEASRLLHPSTNIEFLTTCRYIDRYLKAGDRILDIGAGYGIYSIKYAQKGYRVDAIELMAHHVKGMKEKVTSDMNLVVQEGNALDLSRYEDESFDLVLCLGPLYHLHGTKSKKTCIQEAKRVCKQDGVMIFAYISNDACMISEQFANNNKHLLEGEYNQETFHFDEDVFSFLTIEEARSVMDSCGLKKELEVAADGLSELLRDKIKELDEEYYRQWLRFHFHICEKPEMLGYSNHVLYIARKPKEEK